MPDNLTQEFKDEVRKQATQQAAKWTLAGAVMLAVFAVTGWWLYLQPKIDEYIASKANGLPSGAVVAFNSSESQTCPGASWKLFNDAKGRFIVGAGHGNESILTPRKLGIPGGNEKIRLSANQLPAHTHNIVLSDTLDKKLVDATRFDQGGGNSPLVNNGGKRHPYALAKTITSQNNVTANVAEAVMNNMPPYIPLYYCIKD